MASSSHVPDISSVLQCAICVEEYNGANLPRTLPCSHVFCTTCLTELARNPAGTITCPVCRIEHNVAVEELIISRPVMDLKDIKHAQRKAERQIQRSDCSDSASTVRGQAQSTLQTFDSDIQGLLTSLKSSMLEASQSGKILERVIKETNWKRETILQTTEIAKRAFTDRMDRVIKAVTERKQQLLQSLDDALQESLSLLTDITEDFKARLEAHERFCRKMVEKEEAWQADAQSDLEEIKKLIQDIQDKKYFQSNISIPLKDLLLDIDGDKYQRILRDVSSWGGIKTEHITHEVSPVHPQTQPILAAETQHHLAKTKTIRTISTNRPVSAAQLENGDIAIGSLGNQITVFDSDLMIQRESSLFRNMSHATTGMCVTQTGKLCISNLDMNTVQVVTAEGRVESSFRTCLPRLEKCFSPRGLASNKEGEVFVCDWANDIVRVFDQSGQECRRFGGLGEEPGKLRDPWDVAVTPDGNVAVADTGNHRIQVFDGATGRYLAKIGSHGSGINQLNGPTGIAIDTMGFVAVAEEGNNRVQLFTPSWESFHIIKNQEDRLKRPWGITITKSNAIVVCNHWGDMVHIF